MCATPVLKSTDRTSRALIERSAIGRFFGQSLLDITSDNLGQRQATFSSLSPQPARLLIGELNLRPDHAMSVSTA